jgi:hypothetical protein
MLLAHLKKMRSISCSILSGMKIVAARHWFIHAFDMALLD